MPLYFRYPRADDDHDEISSDVMIRCFWCQGSFCIFVACVSAHNVD
jgi:hypothetical protein